MRILAIIPARGGSKGIPDKNIREVHGKPLISYTIEAALQSTLADEIWVSSDDERILQVAKTAGVFLSRRPKEMAGDESPVDEAVNYLLEQAGDDKFDAVMLLQPTAPIRTGADIDRAVKILRDNPEANSVISVCEMDDVHPARMYSLNGNSHLSSFIPEFESARRQDIPKAYYRNGSIYLVRMEAFRQTGSLMAKPAIPYIMDRKYLCNIDDPRDLIVAEALIKAWQEGSL